MDTLTANMPMLVFLLVGAVAVACSILVVSMRNPVHSALFLLVTFLCVAILFVIKSAEFVAAVQVLVYAGGIMVLFLFVVMLINVRNLPEEKILSSFWKGGLAVGLGFLILMATIVRTGAYGDPVEDKRALQTYTTSEREKVVAADGTSSSQMVERKHLAGNSEAVGMLLYTKYLVPFEVASLFLLVAMIGAIVIGKRELSVDEEETTPQFILDRAETEHEVKEKLSA